MDAPRKIPCLKIDFNRVSIYDSYQSFWTRDERNSTSRLYSEIDQQTQVDFIEKRQHDGTLSKAAKNHLLECIERFVFYTNRVNEMKKKKHLKGKRSLKFVTLTLSGAQEHSDVEIKKVVLNQFLTELRENYKMKHYVWKAEKQKNGNLHFHLIIDVYIHYEVIRKIWNRCQNRLGYIDKFKKRMQFIGYDGYKNLAILSGEEVSLETIRARWLRLVRSDFSDPPSTEIKNVEKVNNVRSYFAKYFSKDSKVDAGFGRIWFASRSLTKELSLRIDFSGGYHKILDFLTEKFPKRLREYDYASVFYVKFDLIEKNVNDIDVWIFQKKLNEYILDFW